MRELRVIAGAIFAILFMVPLAVAGSASLLEAKFDVILPDGVRGKILLMTSDSFFGARKGRMLVLDATNKVLATSPPSDDFHLKCDGIDSSRSLDDCEGYDAAEMMVYLAKPSEFRKAGRQFSDDLVDEDTKLMDKDEGGFESRPAGVLRILDYEARRPIAWITISVMTPLLWLIIVLLSLPAHFLLYRGKNKTATVVFWSGIVAVLAPFIYLVQRMLPFINAYGYPVWPVPAICLLAAVLSWLFYRFYVVPLISVNLQSLRTKPVSNPTGA